MVLLATAALLGAVACSVALNPGIQYFSPWLTGAAVLLALGGIVLVIRRAKQSQVDRASLAELERTTARLEAQKRMMDALIQAVPIIVSVKSADGRILMMNAECERFHGRPATDFVGKTDLDLYPPDQAARIRRQDEAVLASGRLMALEERFVNVDGREHWVEKRKIPVDLPDGGRAIITCLQDITDTKRAHDEAKSALDFLSAIVDAVPYGMFVKDANHVWVHANRTFIEQMSPTGESLIGKTDSQFLPADGAATAWAQDDQVLSNGKTLIGEGHVTFSDGRTMWVEKSKSRLMMPDGAVYIVGLIRDITALKQAEQALRLNETRWTSLVSTAREGIVVIDETGTIESANEAMHRMFGYELGALVGRSVHALLPSAHNEPTSRLFALQPTRPATAGRIVHHVEAVRADASTFPVEISVSEFRLGELRMFTGVLRDQSEMTVQRDIARQTERVARIGGWDFDLISRKLHWTEGTCRIHEVDPESFEPDVETAIDFYAPEYRARIIQLVDQAVSNGTPYDEVLQIVTAKGRRVWVRTVGQAVIRDGRPVKLFGAFQDVTLQKQLDEELRLHRDQLQHLVEERTAELSLAKDAAEAASRAKSEFLNNMSHELRTPMHAILSFADLGTKRLRDGDTVKVLAYIGKIDQSAHRLLRLVNDLLDLSKMESGRMSYEMSTHDVVSVLHGVLAELESVAAQKQIALVCEASDTEMVAMVDPTRIEQLLRNLLANAIKFSRDGSAVHVHLHRAPRTDSSIILEVRDHGPGVPPEELEVVFDKFIQSSRTRSGAGGTGLGLAICREIVHAHGGTIVAANAPDGGAVFTVRLPVAQAGSGTRTSASATQSAPLNRGV